MGIVIECVSVVVGLDFSILMLVEGVIFMGFFCGFGVEFG